MAWRVAKSLLKFRAQFDEQYPNRSRKADGTIGDAAHASRNSDHNPWIKDAGMGVVSAMDITHDLQNGPNTHEVAEYMRLKKDRRIKYVISNWRIFSSSTKPWVWRKYTGANGHVGHMHVSVKSSKNHYDDESLWDLFAGAKPAPTQPTLKPGDRGEQVEELQRFFGMPLITGIYDLPTELAVKAFQLEHGLKADGIVGQLTWRAIAEASNDDPDSPADRPILKRGSSGTYVIRVQDLLRLPPDGKFGAATEAAVKGFQRACGLNADGIVGPQTWAELDALENIPTDKNWQRNITATVFGGKRNPEKSAYADRWITDEELGCALPFRFKGDRPQVDIVNVETGKRVTCDIVDVGPWTTNDPYWLSGTRPEAESGHVGTRKTNLAGIDLTPAAAKTIGLAGKGLVNWSFAGEEDEGEV